MKPSIRQRSNIKFLNTNNSQRASGSILILGVFTALLFYVCIGAFRFVDGDEGFYLYATKLFVSGEKPYLDFFYPQMPAFLYVYAVVAQVFENGWYIYRGLGALFATFSVGIVVWYSYSRLKNLLISLLLLGLFSFSGLCVGWLVVAKTYGLSVLALSISVVLFLCYLESKNNYFLFFSALALGLLGSVRMMLFGIAPVYVFFIWCSRDSLRSGLLSICLFSVAVLLGLSSLLIYLLDDWSVFWFNNLGYHGIRSGDGFVGNLDQKFDVLKALFGIRANHGYYFGIQNLVSILALWHLRKVPASIQSRFLMALLVVLVAICLLPTPTFTQYFVVLIPIVLLLLFELIRSGVLTGVQFYNKKYVLILLLMYLAVFPLEVYRYAVSGKRVPGVVHAAEWKIDSISKITAWINSNVEPGANIVSFWPGFLLESKFNGLPGSENHFGWQVVDKLTAVEAEHYHLMTFDQLSKLIKVKQLDYLVLNMWTVKRDFVESLLRENGYEIAFQMHGVSVWANAGVNTKL